MRFPQKFPYTSINNINLDWIIKKVKEALRIANEAADNVSGAIEAAAAAEASADAAQAAAQAAESAAAGVVDTAQEALTTAQAAQTTAEGIAGTASQALTTAQAAQTTANSANTTAQAAQTTAEGIATTANTALSTAQAAQTTAQAAQTTAEDAQETAQGVESIAQAAQTAAQAAQTTANSANTAAQAAQTAANTALARALPAGGSAGQVLAKVDGVDYNAHWIPAPDPTGFVSYAQAQTLTDAQKTQARNNIEAVKAEVERIVFEGTPAANIMSVDGYYKNGWVRVDVVLKAHASGWVSDNVTGLPSKYYPQQEMFTLGVLATTSDSGKVGYGFLATDGKFSALLSATFSAGQKYAFIYPLGY